MALRRALLEALAVEDRARSAEQRAADAETRAAVAEQRYNESERMRLDVASDLRSMRMARYTGRHEIIAGLHYVAGGGRLETSIRTICFACDEYLTSEGGDAWALEITLAGMINVHHYKVYTYWTVELLKRLVHDSSLLLKELVSEPTTLLFMHCGMIMDDKLPLGSYDLFDPARENELPIVYISHVP